MAAAAPAPVPPAHKLIPGCGFLVDGFRYAASTAVKAYFLTHAHSDHYTGLKEDWERGPIHCSEVTARLVQHMLGVRPQFLRPLAMDTPVDIQGVEVTLVDANHCPGAVQFLFRLPDGRRYIHTGDMRFAPALLDNPHLQRFKGCNALFLDTTYCNPRFCFPAQEESIEHVAATVHRLLQFDAAQEAGPEGGQDQPGDAQGGREGGQPGHRFRRLYLIATYGIGKERLLTAVHDRCGVKLLCSDRKHAVMQQLDLPGYDPAGLFTTDPSETPVHVVQWGFLGETWPFFRPNFTAMEEFRQQHGADEVVGFVPTGWLYEMKREKFSVRSKGACAVHLVPYSEHSSFAELQEYVRFLRPHKVVPTVGVDGEDADKARSKMLRHFRLLVDETASKATFLAGFRRSSSKMDGEQGAEGEQQEAEEQGGADCAEVVDLAAEEGEEDRGEQQLQEQQRQEQPKRHPTADMQPVQQGNRHMPQQPVAPTGPPLSPSGAAEQAAALEGTGVPAPAAASSLAGEDSDPQLEQLLAVLGEDVSRQHGRQLLAAARGDLQAAINGFLDSQAGSSGSGTAGARHGGSRDAHRSSQSPAAGGRANSKAGAKRPPAAAAAKGGIKRQKGAAGAAGGAGQRSIAAFFAKPLLSKQQPQDQQQQQRQRQQQASSVVPSSGRAVEAADLAGSEMKPAPAVGPQQAEHGDDELALTLDAPLAARLPPSPAAAGLKPKLKLPPPPPSPGGTKASGAAAVAARSSGAGGSGAGSGQHSGRASGREVEVSRDALALPLDKYDPVEHACWAAGQPTPYLHIARAFDLMDGTTKRLRISDVLVNCFRSVLALGPPGEVVTAAYLLSGRIAPDYEPGAELNVGGRTVVAAITEATGASRARLSERYRELGDLGDVAQACKRTQGVLQRPAPLTVPGVFATLQQISREKGQGAAARRQRLVLSLLRACRESETKFIVRTLIQALRVGANWRSLIPALGKAALVHREQALPPKARLDAAAAAATAAFHVCPNLQLLADVLLAHPPEEWQQRCSLTPGIPIKPMLAKICEGLPDAIQQLKGAPFLAEYKYDGMRAQIHMTADGEVRIFSRNCEEKTGAYPDVVQQTLDAATGGAQSAILDAELVAVERSPEAVRLRAFQELATRKRADVEAGNIEIPVCIFAFDLLFRDGASLARLPLAERRRQLAQAFPAMRPGFFAMAESVEFAGEAAGAGGAAGAAGTSGTAGWAVEAGMSAGAQAVPDDAAADAVKNQAETEEPAGRAAQPLEPHPAQQADGEQGTVEAAGGAAGAEQAAAPLEDRLQECLLEAFAAGTEGLMLKALTGPYEPSKRSDHWIKLKRDYCEGLHDTLDLVVIGAWYGNGRKAGWYSPYLLACWDPDTEELQSVCRCMSGFTDQFYRDSLERLSKTVIPGPKPYVRTDEQPSVWFEPREVWEIRGADLTVSPVHKAALGRVHESRGLGLRFPRFLRVREDKGPEDATSADQLTQMFHAQTRKVETAGQRLAAKQRQQPAADRPPQRLRQGLAQAGKQQHSAGAADEGHLDDSDAGASGSDGEEDEGGQPEQRRRASAIDLGL